MDEERERIEILAERIRLLFGFCGDLIKDKDLVGSVLELSSDALSATPVLGVLGLGYEAENFDATFRQKRAKAILILLDVLESTKIGRMEFQEKQKERAAGRAQTMKAPGKSQRVIELLLRESSLPHREFSFRLLYPGKLTFQLVHFLGSSSCVYRCIKHAYYYLT